MNLQSKHIASRIIKIQEGKFCVASNRLHIFEYESKELLK